jgi:hypothetical protein
MASRADAAASMQRFVVGMFPLVNYQVITQGHALLIQYRS